VTDPQAHGRAALRRARRRRQVRLTAVLLGVLLLVATAFAVWLALDAQGPLPVPQDSGLGGAVLPGD
jgi:hypothetical protein